MTCNHCKDVETVAHILLYCPEVYSFWQKVRYLICTQFNININIDEKMLLIGCDVENGDMILLNIILIFAQFTIYRVYMLCKFTSKQFNSFSLTSEFKRELVINLKFLEKNNMIKLTEEQYSEIQML